MRKKKVLVIGHVWPEPNSSAAGSRLLQIIDLFQDQKCELIFASAALKSEFSFDLNLLGIKSYQIELNSSSFDKLLKNENPEIVLFDRFMTEEQFGWRVREICPNAITILDTEDLHFLRFARQKAFKEKRKFQIEEIYTKNAKREIASILRCDLTFIISEFEMKLLKKEFHLNSHILFYLPFLLDDFSEKVNVFEERKDFSFIGNFFHEPNIQAVLFLKEKIWPIILEKLKDVKLHIYGAYIPLKISNLHNEKERFLIKGRVEDASEVFRYSRVFLAPLLFGAGQKGKLFEAMIYGIPSVTTSIGAESMHGDLPWNGFISDDEVEFSNCAIDLYSNKQLWNLSQKNGFEILKNRFLKKMYAEKLYDVINYISMNLEQHRKHNFFGEILKQNEFNASKYMSKWIEEKNKTNA